MNDRRTRRYKERRSLFPFGQLMLPIVGVVALGILILGIRLFFLPSKPSAPLADLAAPVAPSVPSLPVEPPDVGEAPQKPELTVKPSAIAVPVKDGNLDEAPAEKPAAPVSPASAKPAPSSSSPSGAVQAPKPAQTTSAQGNWGVQVGAFTSQDMANGLASKLRANGENVIVVQADISGKAYFRVRVVAGSTRQDAEKKAQVLKSQGYPTLVVAL